MKPISEVPTYHTPEVVEQRRDAMTPHALPQLLSLATSPDGLQQLRVLVAKLDGWLEIERCSRNSLKPHPNGAQWRGTKDAGSERIYEILPAYATSLDAMADVLSRQSNETLKHFADKILAVDDLQRARIPEAWRWAVAYILVSQKPSK